MKQKKKNTKTSESNQSFRPNEELTGNRGGTLQRYKIELMGTSTKQTKYCMKKIIINKMEGEPISKRDMMLLNSSPTAHH